MMLLQANDIDSLLEQFEASKETTAEQSSDFKQKCESNTRKKQSTDALPAVVKKIKTSTKKGSILIPPLSSTELKIPSKLVKRGKNDEIVTTTNSASKAKTKFKKVNSEKILSSHGNTSKLNNSIVLTTSVDKVLPNDTDHNYCHLPNYDFIVPKKSTSEKIKNRCIDDTNGFIGYNHSLDSLSSLTECNQSKHSLPIDSLTPIAAAEVEVYDSSCQFGVVPSGQLEDNCVKIENTCLSSTDKNEYVPTRDVNKERTYLKEASSICCSYNENVPDFYKSLDGSNKKPWPLKNIEKYKQLEERRIVYVGKIENSMTKEDLKDLFLKYGPIQNVSIHFRENGDNYGFVTFQNKEDAYQVVSCGHYDPEINCYNLSFGGRRQFCRTKYSDLDSGNSEETSSLHKDIDFDTLLKSAARKTLGRELFTV